ncbi:MAG: hypothetical protein QOE61_1459 [Micromonosporaceae bacterium]|jgi:hypothetical protein|nr:hypothetical protein [Micromonosporaceae bacterium]
MSIVVAVPQVTGRSTGTGTAAATALAGGMTAIALALLGPSAVMPAPRTVAMRRWRETGTVTTSGSSRRWQGAALDGPACLVVVGDAPAIFDAGRARLLDLGAKWAPKGGHSEIAALSAYPGVMLPVSADTVLLADLVNGGSASGPLLVNVRHGTVGRRADQKLDVSEAARVLAGDLVLGALLDAGAESASIQLGSFFRVRASAAPASARRGRSSPTTIAATGRELSPHGRDEATTKSRK